MPLRCHRIFSRKNEGKKKRDDPAYSNRRGKINFGTINIDTDSTKHTLSHLFQPQLSHMNWKQNFEMQKRFLGITERKLTTMICCFSSSDTELHY